MAANDNVEVTPTKLKLEEGVVATPTAFASSSANQKTSLVITPSRGSRKLIVIIREVSGSQGTIKVNCSAGSFWAGKALTETSIAQGTAKAFVFESAKHYGNQGDDATALDAKENKIQVTATPASGKKLGTDHTATWQVLELP